MAGLLTNRRMKWIVLAFWLVLVAVAAPLAGKLMGAEHNDAKSWLPASAESTQVLDTQAQFVSPNTVPAVVVYERDSPLSQADLAKIMSDVGTFSALPDLDGQVTGPIPSADLRAAQVIVPVDLGPQGWSRAGDLVTSIRSTASDSANGMAVYVTGPAGVAADSSEAFAGIDSTLLYAAGAVVIVILLLTYRSPFLWLLPVISAGVALTIAQAVIYLLARHSGLVVNAQSAGILTVLVFGAGTDYALLLVARYREELRRHHDRHEAMAVALHRAGPAIIASGSTVVVGMLCLLLARTNSTAGLGPVAAIGVLVALAVMLTLLPALLVIVSRWVFWPTRPVEGSAEPTATGFWARVGSAVARAPRLTWILTSVALGVLAIGLVQLHATGLTTKQSFRGTPASVAGAEALARHFPAGSGDPVVVTTSADHVDQVSSAVAGTPGIVGASVTPPMVRGEIAVVTATLVDAPDSQPAYDTIDRVRDRVHAVPGADAKVGGDTAINLDVQRTARYDRTVIIPIVLAVVFVILALLLRAIVAPLLLIATVVLSFAAALGVSALVFQHVLGYGGADTALPLFVFVFLVALGVDYNIFLMTRVREETRTRGTRPATLVALAATGGVITSAGLVLAGTFAVLATLPLTAFAEVGFAVAFGVLLDTIVVRSVLVTALNLDIGRHIWWPHRYAHEPDVPAAQARG
ncbi:MAG TPA: MMPL family transporter [Micromonosporaceae bacterium]|jgi:RND superfamily putative drug exporter